MSTMTNNIGHAQQQSPKVGQPEHGSSQEAMIEFRMPSLGADMESGTLREWRKKTGDTVKRGDIIADVETQKGIIEVEIFDEGVIEELLIKEDEKVPVDTVMALIRGGGKAIVEAASEPPVTVSASTPTATPTHRLHISPLAKRIATENGIDISSLKGTGEEGAITRDDVEHAIAARTSARPAPEKETPPPVAAPITPDAATSVRRAVAAAMEKSNREIPHYHVTMRLDMDPAMRWLTAFNANRPLKEHFLPVVLLIKATALALTKVPDLNGTWNDGLRRSDRINIGFVVSLRGGGVIVPAIHDADTRSLGELMTMLNDIIPRARALKLRSSELADGTFTLTNLGDLGVDSVSGIIYPPQVAIAGFGGIHEEPWAENGMVGARPVVHASLAADHRATDGATGSRFLREVAANLMRPETL